MVTESRREEYWRRYAELTRDVMATLGVTEGLQWLRRPKTRALATRSIARLEAGWAWEKSERAREALQQAQALAAEWETAVREVEANSDLTGSELATMREDALRLSRATGGDRRD